MSYEVTQLNFDPLARDEDDHLIPVDNLPQAAGKINANLTAIKEMFDTLLTGTSSTVDFNYAKTALAGGGEYALDGIDGAVLLGDETAIVFMGNNPARVYVYRLDADSGQPESVPYVIAPDANAGNKRWTLAARVPRRWVSVSSPAANNDETQGVAAGDEWQTGTRIWKCLSELAGAAVWLEWLQLGTGPGNAAAGDHTHAAYATTAALGAVASEVASHEGAAAPHSGHATTSALSSHTGAAAPHSGHATTTDLNSHAAAAAPHSGHATLTGGKVDQDPANATATPTASKIPIADAYGKLDGWITDGKAFAMIIAR